MEELLDRLEKWLRKKRLRFLKALQPGADAKTLTKLKKALGFPVPDDLRALLSWHNGQSAEFAGRFEEDWLLLSAERIAAAKTDLDAGAAETGWKPKWVPFLDDDAGDYLFLDTSKKGVPVRSFYLGTTTQEILALSLQAWLEDFVTAVEAACIMRNRSASTFMRVRRSESDCEPDAQGIPTKRIPRVGLPASGSQQLFQIRPQLIACPIQQAFGRLRRHRHLLGDLRIAVILKLM